MQGFDQTTSIKQLQAELNLKASAPALQIAPAIWQSYTDKALVYPRLQFLYTKRQLIEKILADWAENVDFDEIGLRQDDSDVSDHYSKLWSMANGEIIRLESIARGNRPAAVGQITQVRPETPTVGRPDPGDQFYTGVAGRKPPFPFSG